MSKNNIITIVGGFFAAIILLTSIFIFMLSGNSANDEEMKQNKQQQTERRDKQIQKTNYNGNLKVVLEAFNEVMSNNNCKIFYAGVKYDSPDKLVIYVYKEKMTKKMIEDFAHQSINAWKGIAKARSGADLSYETFEMELIDKTDGKEIMSWEIGPSGLSE